MSHQPTCFASATAPEQLRFLDLQGSFDGGRIPNDLVCLSQLQYLDLSYNVLVGSLSNFKGGLVSCW